MTKQHMLKALAAGAVASLSMFVIMLVTLESGVAPFELSPSAALALRLGLPPQPAGLVIHLGYGMTAAAGAVLWVRGRVLPWHGIVLGSVLWLLLMTLWGQIFGWGLFGLMGSEMTDPRLALSNPLHYVVTTLLLHLVYGGTVGYLAAAWIPWPEAPVRLLPSLTERSSTA